MLAWSFLFIHINELHVFDQIIKSLIFILKLITIKKANRSDSFLTVVKIKTFHHLQLFNIFSLFSFHQRGKRVLDSSKVRAARFRASSAVALREPGGQHVGAAADCSDWERPAQAAASPGPQHQGSGQHSASWIVFVSSDGSPCCLSAGRCSHDPAPCLGEFSLPKIQTQSMRFVSLIRHPPPPPTTTSVLSNVRNHIFLQIFCHIL